MSDERSAVSKQTQSSSASSIHYPLPTTHSSPIRILLSVLDFPSLTMIGSAGRVSNDQNASMTIASGQSVRLIGLGSGCQATIGTQKFSGTVLRFSSDTGTVEVSPVGGKTRRYRGILECRMIGNNAQMINELSLEDYLRGLAEEPDTELYEKQRAFAMAARSYAAYWMQADHRKFPGMPYDGTDSPATFQSYAGALQEAANPQ